MLIYLFLQNIICKFLWVLYFPPPDLGQMKGTASGKHSLMILWTGHSKSTWKFRQIICFPMFEQTDIFRLAQKQNNKFWAQIKPLIQVSFGTNVLYKYTIMNGEFLFLNG